MANLLVSARLEQFAPWGAGATAMAPINVAGVQYLAVANATTAGAVYRRDPATGQFTEMTMSGIVLPMGAEDVTAVSVDDERSAFVAFVESGKVIVFRLSDDASSWFHHQTITYEGSHGIEGFSAAKSSFLAVSVEHKHER